MNADYVAAVDDSGGVEALSKWDGTPIEGDHPITVLATGVIKRDVLEEFEGQWNELRADIQRELGCPQPPPLHMRIMWGKHIKKIYRKELNPYINADFEQIKKWYARALDIILSFNRYPKTLGFWSFNASRAQEAQRHTRYFQTPQFLAEMIFLRQHSRAGKWKKMYRGYHNRISSPLLPLFSSGFPYLNEVMNVVGRKSIDVLVDPFGEAHGVDAKEVLDAIVNINELTRIASVRRIKNADDLPICQAVDVMGYSYFRRKMAQAEAIKPDLVMNTIFADRKFNSFTTANLRHIVDRKYPDLNARQMTIHYAIARQHIQNIDAGFAEQHMISVKDFFERAKATGADDIGISVLKDVSVCADILASLNDEDRG